MIAATRRRCRPFEALAVACLATCLAACASAPPRLDATESQGRGTARFAFVGSPIVVELTPDDRIVETDVSATPERVWAVLPAVYAALEIPVTTLMADQRLIGTQASRVPRQLAGEPLSRAVSCGTGPLGLPNADTYEVTLLALTDVQPLGSRALVRTLVRGGARARGTSDVGVRCASVGRIEQRIGALVRARVAAR